jgi:TonB-dependent SusC/RagA subfamily outer membrane receptor
MIKLNIILSLCLSLNFIIIPGQEKSKKITVSGFVYDANQKPVPGAVVFIDNEKTNIFSNQKGKYKVRINPTAEKISILVAEGLAFDEKINGRTKINFFLKSYSPRQINNEELNNDEEEVDIGYGTVKKKDLTRSRSSIDGQSKRYSSYGNIYDMISGELPGVQVIGRNIRIQGASSINSGTEPLFVVDGITATSIDNIQPRLVKSIEVLKGPAASIYGARGANGVILISLISSGNTGNKR